MKKCGIISKTYGMVKYKYETFEYVNFDLEKLKEYDKIGVKKFIKESSNYKDIILQGYQEWDYDISKDSINI